MFQCVHVLHIKNSLKNYYKGKKKQRETYMCKTQSSTRLGFCLVCFTDPKQKR